MNRSRRVAGLADHNEILFVFQDAAKSRADKSVLVDQENGDFCGEMFGADGLVWGALRTRRKCVIGPDPLFPRCGHE